MKAHLLSLGPRLCWFGDWRAAERLSEVLWFREDLGWAEAGVRSHGIMETMRMRRA